MRQKSWILLTLMLMQVVSRKYGTDTQLLGQGDNVIICFPISDRTILEETRMTVGD